MHQPLSFTAESVVSIAALVQHSAAAIFVQRADLIEDVLQALPMLAHVDPE
jgi:hypothetical protein